MVRWKVTVVVGALVLAAATACDRQLGGLAGPMSCATDVDATGAIVGSAALFACVHANVWPTPVPLALLALALGWLAMRTQSVIAPIVVHMLFNTVAFVELALG